MNDEDSHARCAPAPLKIFPCSHVQLSCCFGGRFEDTTIRQSEGGVEPDCPVRLAIESLPEICFSPTNILFYLHHCMYIISGVGVIAGIPGLGEVHSSA
jgi:hypothetical protein